MASPPGAVQGCDGPPTVKGVTRKVWPKAVWCNLTPVYDHESKAKRRRVHKSVNGLSGGVPYTLLAIPPCAFSQEAFWARCVEILCKYGASSPEDFTKRPHVSCILDASEDKVAIYKDAVEACRMVNEHRGSNITPDDLTSENLVAFVTGLSFVLDPKREDETARFDAELSPEALAARVLDLLTYGAQHPRDKGMLTAEGEVDVKKVDKATHITLNYMRSWIIAQLDEQKDAIWVEMMALARTSGAVCTAGTDDFATACTRAGMKLDDGFIFNLLPLHRDDTGFMYTRKPYPWLLRQAVTSTVEEVD